MSYTVTTSYAIPLKKKDKLEAAQVVKKKKTLKPIINPIFEQCASLTEDKFWIATFMDCARGKFPRGFSFRNDLLTYKKANKAQRLEVSDSPSEAFTSIIEFFQKVGGIMSVLDRQMLQKNEDEKLVEKMAQRIDSEWKDIKIEKMKDILINEFIVDVAEKMEMDENEIKELTTTVKKGIMLKYFGRDNIKMENGKIVAIEGLIYNEKTKEYEIDKSYITKRSGRKVIGLGIEEAPHQKSKNTLNFLELWEKFLEQLESKRIKKTYSSSYSTHLDESDSIDVSTDNTISNLSYTT